MIFYTFFDGEYSQHFSSKSEAMKEARELWSWNCDNEVCDYPITVEKINIGNINRNKLLQILNRRGYVENRDIVTTIGN